jgi:exonuclease SbcC
MNDVLNAYMDDIKTDDVLVLDEPTDGFSGEQLDRLRDILRSLQASQILIVSHEEKLEGVTENIISVEKTNNRSQIV